MNTPSKERLEEIRDCHTCVTFEESAAMARELLALLKEREAAVPVAWRKKESGWCGTVVIQGKSPLDCGYEPLYTTPPAQPVAVPVRYMNRYTGACYTLEQQPDAATDTMVYVPLYDVAQPVAVPDEMLAAMEEVLRISDRDHEAWHRARDGIASCRAAMLNQPSSIQASNVEGARAEIKQPASNYPG